MKHIIFLELTENKELETETLRLIEERQSEVILFGTLTANSSKKELKQAVSPEVRKHLHSSVAVPHKFKNWADLLTWMAKHLCEDFTILASNDDGFRTGPSYIKERLMCPQHKNKPPLLLCKTTTDSMATTLS